METYEKLTPFDIAQKPIPQYEILINNIISKIINKSSNEGFNTLITGMNFDISQIHPDSIKYAGAFKQAARRGIMNIGIGYIPKLPYLTKEEIVKLLKKEFNNKAIIIDEKDGNTMFMIHKQDFFRYTVEKTLRFFFDTNYIKDIYFKLEPITLVYTTFHIINSKEE